MKVLAFALFTMIFGCGVALAKPAVTSDTFAPYQTADEVPDTVVDLWQDCDLQSEPLDTEVIKEWTEDGVVCRYVIFTVATVKGQASRIAAFYTFPEGAKNIPGVVWAHGGGQRAEVRRGMYFAKQGYALVDINWNGREILEGVEQNTDWGAIDPTQGPKFYPPAKREQTKLDFRPDQYTIDPVLSPRNGNWFMLAYAGRRAITFLEHQPEVDKDRLGFTGFSMGGNITSFAAIDPRLKAVVPMVGGSGYVTTGFVGMPEGARQFRKPDHSELHAATMQSQSYYRHTTCPVLLLSASDDFHSRFEFIYQALDCLPHDQWRVSQNMHLSHTLSPQQWILLKLWFDKYLKGEAVEIAKTPTSKLQLASDRTSARFTVTPDSVDELTQCDIYYSHDPNAKSRFWIQSPGNQSDGSWQTDLPVRANLPLYVFAQCTYRLNPPAESFRGTAHAYSITSDEQVHLPETVLLEQLDDEAKPTPLFSDLESDGFRDWGFTRRGGLTTYKFRDPRMTTPDASVKLRIVVESPRPRLNVRLTATKNKYVTGVKAPKVSYAAAKPISKAGVQELVFSANDFCARGKKAMSDWTNIATFSVDLVDRGTMLDFTKPENGNVVRRLEWVAP